MVFSVPRTIVSLPYTPLRPTIQKVLGSIPVNVYGDEIDKLVGLVGPRVCSHSP